MAIPKKDALLVAWGSNFDTKGTANPTTYNLTAGEMTSFHTAYQAFVSAYNAVVDARAAGARSKLLTNTKDTAKTALLTLGRELYSFVQDSTSVTDANKADIGVVVKKINPTPIPPPAVKPGMDLVSVTGRTVRVNIHDSASSSKKGKPAGAIGSNVYSFAGATYPTDPAAWQFEGQATRNIFDVTFPDTVAGGSQVWICATWYTRRGETGPISTPLTTFLQGGLSMAA
jgi:hypothetical protein